MPFVVEEELTTNGNRVGEAYVLRFQIIYYFLQLPLETSSFTGRGAMIVVLHIGPSLQVMHS